MPKPRPSVLKRQREQAKRDKKAAKAEKKAERGNDDGSNDEFGEPVRETPIDPAEIGNW